jgi:hypothetical protein
MATAMPIKFLCPNPACKKPLNAKDHLAGKKMPCPACKQALTIPAPVSKPADAEEMAANVFSDPPPAAPVAAPKFVEFNCPMCDEKLKLSAELAGKRAPCPECRRIVKVPELQKEDPKDWRQPTKKVPSGAKAAQPEKLEGAWDDASSKVNTKVLEEAGILPEKREPLTARQWAFRIGAPVVGVVLLGVLGWFGWSWLSQRARDTAVSEAIKAVKDGKFSKEEAAEVHRAAGEYYLRSGERRCVEKSKDEFGVARGLLDGATGGSNERDLLLIDLAVSQVELGSDKTDEEVTPGLRLKWKDAVTEVGRALTAIRNPEAKVRGMREVMRQMLARGQSKQLAALLSSLSADDDLLPEVCGVVGLDVERNSPPGGEANPKAKEETARLADQFIDHGLGPYARHAGGKAPASSAALITLCLVRNKQANLVKQWPAAGDVKNTDDQLVRAGWVAAGSVGSVSLQGPVELKPDGRFQAQLLLAEWSAAQAPDQAKAAVEDAVQQLQGPQKAQPSGWLLLRLVEAELRAGDVEKAQNLAQSISDPALRGRAQLEVLQAKLQAEKGEAKTTATDSVEKLSVGHLQAWELVARTNARRDGGIPKTVNDWPDPVKPFGKAGAALGVLDAGK